LIDNFVFVWEEKVRIDREIFIVLYFMFKTETEFRIFQHHILFVFELFRKLSCFQIPWLDELDVRFATMVIHSLLVKAN
jgi:hypothetical protein